MGSPNNMSRFKNVFGFWIKFGVEKKILLAALLSILISTFVYQNCSDSASFPTNSLASLAASVDFPYQAQVDQIAYMSCNQMTAGSYDKSAYFHFRVGAYRSGSGISIDPSFMQNSKVTSRSLSDQVQLITTAPSTVGAQPQLAIRDFSDFQSIVTQNQGGRVQNGDDIATFFTPVDGADFALVALNNKRGEGVRYVRNETAAGQRLEGSLYFNSNYATSSDIRNQLNSGSVLLALTYKGTNTASQNSARAPIDFGLSTRKTDISVYGRGYQLNFRSPQGAYGQYPINVLASVSEIDLKSRGVPSAGAQWTCDPAMQFKILRTSLIADVTLAGCQIHNDDPADAKLAIVRNSLKTEDWYVDMVNRCIIPKKSGVPGGGGGCYAGSVGLPANTPLQNGLYANDFLTYNISQTCYQPGTNNNICVEFASICTR